MNDQTPLSSPAKLAVGGLIVAAVGIVIQIASGVDFPTIPPGLIILLLAAGLVAFGRWRWTPLVGAVVGLSQLLGLFLADQADRLLDPSPLGGAVGLWIQLLGVIVAFVAGIVATVRRDPAPAPGPTR